MSLVEYLQATANFKADHAKVPEQATLEGFVLKHGREYQSDVNSFIGGEQGMCYANAAKAVFADRSLTYVEGYVTVYGVPIQHAWAVDRDGRVLDFTLGRADHRAHAEFFGVPFQTEFVLKTVLRAKMYGLLTYPTIKKVIKANPKRMLVS